MGHRILGGRRRRLLLATLVVAVGGLAAFMITSALAVHELKFQLDGDTSTACGTVPKCTEPGAQIYDWDSLFNADGTNTSLVSAAGPFTSAKFVRDFEVKPSKNGACSLTGTSGTFCTGDGTTYATGSKDTLNISASPGVKGWECNRDANVNSKIDIMNAYAASYTDPASGHKILYFGLDKNKDNGNNNVGFWFLQGSAGCTAGTGSTAWTGTHKDGDILVVSEFTKGGGVSGIAAYRWAGDAKGCIDSHDNPSKAAGGCNEEPIGEGGDCKTVTGGSTDAICATTNSGPLPFNKNIETKWLTADATLGVGHEVVPPDFFEGGVDITEEFKNAGGHVPSCFNTFIGDTRSSTSLTATLFDYASGVLGECASKVTTEAGDTQAAGGKASPSSIGSGKVSSGTDTATVTVSGTATWGGTVSWHLCGPVSTDGCDKTKGVLVTPSEEVSNSSPTVVSGTAELTSAGRYCWTAHFEPNKETEEAGLGAADDNGVNECFTVKPVTPTLTTCSGSFSTATPPVCTPSAAVKFGNAIHDNALLQGLATEPGSGGASTTYPTINAATGGAYAGAITFTLYGPSTSGCGSQTSGGTGTNPQEVNVDVSVGNKVYGPVSYTPNAPGSYHWQGTISNSSSTNNSLPVTDNAACNESNENVTVEQETTETTTRQFVYPDDKAQIKAEKPGATLGGEVTFKLFDSEADCKANTATGLLLKEVQSISGTSPQSATTNNTTARVTSGTTVYWNVQYKSTTTSQLGSKSECIESTAVQFAGNDTGISIP